MKKISLLLCVLLLIGAVAGKPIPAKRRGSITLGPKDIDPRAYVYGKVLTDPFLVRPRRGRVWTVVNIRPPLTPDTYGEMYLFCGDQRRILGNTFGQEIVLVFSAAASEVADRTEGLKDVCYTLHYIRIAEEKDTHESRRK